MRKGFLKKVLAVGMMACLLAGCGGKKPDADGSESKEDGTAAGTDTTLQKEESSTGGTDEGTDESKEKVTFKVAVFKHALSKMDDFNEMAGFKAAEEATGVHIDWVYISDGTDEKVNALLTADLPDAFLGLMNESRISNNMDSFLDLNRDGMLNEYAPHVVADYKTVDGGMDLVTWPDGSIRSLMTSSEVSYQNDPDGILVMNQAWLDQLGMTLPTTLDEFYDVLCAFRDHDMNGNGDASDEIPLEFCQSNWAAHVINFMNPWGMTASYKIENGKVLPTYDTQEFRDFLAFMHRLAKEKLLDVEGFTDTNDQYYAKLKEGLVGCYSAWTPYSNMPDEMAADYVTLRVVKVSDEITPVKGGRKNKLQANRTGFAVTTECENPERLLSWWDYMASSTEMKYTVKYGPRGEYWDINEDGTVYQKTPPNLTDDFTVENYKYTYGMNEASPFIRKDEDIEIGKDQAFVTWFRTKMVDEVWDQLADEYLPVRFTPQDKMEEKSFIETDLNGYQSNFIANSIMNGVDDAQWNAHLEQLKVFRYYEWIQWQQDFLDGKF